MQMHRAQLCFREYLYYFTRLCKIKKLVVGDETVAKELNEKAL
jgi:hypothetical protein